MTLEDLQRQKALLEKKQIELGNINLNPIRSQMNLRAGRRAQLQRQQDKGFGDIVRGQKSDVSKKIVSITELISQQQEDPDSIFTNSSQINDFSILPTPKKRKVKGKSRLQKHMGWFLE